MGLTSLRNSRRRELEARLAGAFDALSTVRVQEGAPIAKFYNECVAKNGLSSGQLAQNLKEYVETQPDLQNKLHPVHYCDT